ncbi:MAG: hypothetical protein Ct9H300mP11_32490 [Chloroflexota bacterium]|nr:MAG: hypothetical protein Ct9H300mP11_32490 [Chloroflexota bacterium]
MAPEYFFPAAVEDSLAVYEWAVGHGFEPKNIVLAGDSAGGGFVISTLLKARDSAAAIPGAGICLPPLG